MELSAIYGDGQKGRDPGEVQVGNWAGYRMAEGVTTDIHMGDRVVTGQAVSRSGARPMVRHGNGTGSRPLG